MVESADAAVAGDDVDPRLLGEFIHKVDHVVASYEDEHEIAERVAELLSALLASGYRLHHPVHGHLGHRHELHEASSHGLCSLPTPGPWTW